MRSISLAIRAAVVAISAAHPLRTALMSGAAVIAAIPASAQDIGIPNGFDLGLYAVVVVGAESAGRYDAQNPSTYAVGAYQIMPAKMVDLGYVSGRGRASDAAWSNYTWTAAAQAKGIASIADFKASRAFQDDVFRQLTLMEWSRLGPLPKTKVGTVVGGVLVREGGLLNGAHFLGAGGMANFVNSGFTGANLDSLSTILSQNSMSSLADLDAYVMRRIREGQAAHRDGEGAGSVGADGSVSVSGAELGLSCFQVPVMDRAGEAVSSPFGVDRTGRASPGFHVGLDLVNTARRGSPLVAGLPGKVIVAAAGSVNGVTVQTADGLMRYAFLHNHTVSVKVGDEVAVGDQISTMGDRGSPGAIHLHLMVALRADVVAAAGGSLGRVWAMGSGFGSKGSPLSSGAIPTGSDTYLVVNPETFLSHRIPFQPGLLSSYASQGLDRPDGLTLEPTCGPTRDALAGAGITASSNGGATVGGAADIGSQLVGGQQVVMALATEEARDALIEYGYSSYYELKRKDADISAGGMRAVGWAGMLAARSSKQN